MLSGLLLTWNIDEYSSQRARVERDCTVLCKEEHELSFWAKGASSHITLFIAYSFSWDFFWLRDMEKIVIRNQKHASRNQKSTHSKLTCWHATLLVNFYLQNWVQYLDAISLKSVFYFMLLMSDMAIQLGQWLWQGMWKEWLQKRFRLLYKDLWNNATLTCTCTCSALNKCTLQKSCSHHPKVYFLWSLAESIHKLCFSQTFTND